MCDTMVALASVTGDGSTLFGKNSDREPNEAQAIRFYPRSEFSAGAGLRCTYISIAQARRTHAVLLSQPFWMWGAEMGVNEHGVAIGNEALFTKIKPAQSGLTGMDLVRLGLERGASAVEALDVITGLLEQHGQGGSGGYQHKFFYQNSFLLADRREAWVLETVGRQWAARRVRAGIATISNGLTIGHDFDRASDRLVADAIARRWCTGANDFNFAACYSDFLLTRFSGCRVRQPESERGLHRVAGQLSQADMMARLRSHGRNGAGDTPTPPTRISNGNVCMHYADNLIRINQTTASMVAHLRQDGITVWLTGTAAPCLSLFKPFYLDAPLPDLGPLPGARYDAESLWWQGERLHRAVVQDYAARYPCVGPARDALESRFLTEEAALHAAPAAGRAAFSAECAAQARAAADEWHSQAASTPVTRPAPWLYRRNWRRQSQAAGLPG